jgi:hypothetical protein
VGYFATTLFIARPDEIMVTVRVIKILNLNIVSTVKKAGHVKVNCFILNSRNEANSNGNNKVRTGVAGTTADFVLNLVL